MPLPAERRLANGITNDSLLPHGKDLERLNMAEFSQKQGHVPVGLGINRDDCEEWQVLDDCRAYADLVERQFEFGSQA